MAKKELHDKDQTELEEFLDVEKERLHVEAENWRKTAQDLDLDLKQALKSNEKFIKENQGIKEDYTKVTKVAGQLQQRVYTLEEEVKEMKLKVELDHNEKEKALIDFEELQQALDQEGIPQCPICNRRFTTIDVLQGHMDINHEEGQNESPHINVTTNNTEEMENSNQSGYGLTQEYQLVSVQCKKCDEVLKNNHLLRKHMRKHTKEDQVVLKCTNCQYETPNENSYLEHIVDNHSTIHICQTCNNRFPTKEEMIDHMKREHGYKSANNTANVNPETVHWSDNRQSQHQIKCYDCSLMVQSKDDLMKHKKNQHWKQKPCSYFHGAGSGCRFPDQVCFNIHMMHQHEGQGQMAGAGLQSERLSSWAAAARRPSTRGQGAQGQGSDARARIECRDGSFCRYFRQGDCRYKHTYPSNQNQVNTTNQTHQNETNLNQTSSIKTSENKSSETSFNMQEMKLTIDNLVKAVYNLKSLSDFPKVVQKNQPQ